MKRNKSIVINKLCVLHSVNIIQMNTHLYFTFTFIVHVSTIKLNLRGARTLYLLEKITIHAVFLTSVDTISKVWPIQMKAVEQYFPVVLLNSLYTVTCFSSLWVKSLMWPFKLMLSRGSFLWYSCLLYCTKWLLLVRFWMKLQMEVTKKKHFSEVLLIIQYNLITEQSFAMQFSYFIK